MLHEPFRPDSTLIVPARIDHRRFGWFAAGEGEVVSGVQFPRGVALEGVRHSLQQGGDAARTQRTVNVPNGLMRVTFLHVRLRVRTRHDIDRLLFRLQRVASPRP